MNKILKIVVVLTGVLFLAFGLRWLVDPAASAAHFGMPLLEGTGRNTQIGDFTAFFLTVGVSILLAVKTSQRFWYYPAIMLLSLAALGRILAWLLHDAVLMVDMVTPEILVSILLLVAAGRLTEPNKG